VKRLIRSGLALAPLKFGLGSVPRLIATSTVEGLRAKLAPEPHWYLWVIGVEPSRQGQGLGGELIELMLARVDSDGLPSYLETHKERNVTFYQQYGYNVVHNGDVPNGGPPYWCLKREARR
jgi:GNAT superfamily N-acetyltransferase